MNYEGRGGKGTVVEEERWSRGDNAAEPEYEGGESRTRRRACYYSRGGGKKA